VPHGSLNRKHSRDIVKGAYFFLLNLSRNKSLYKLRNLASYFFFASVIILGSYTFIQLGIKSFKNERESYNRKLARIDSLTKHCRLKEGFLDSLVERTRLQEEPLYVYIVDTYIRLDSSDTLFAMNPSLAYENRYLERNTPLKIRYVYDSVKAKAEVIELWIKERQVYSIAEHLDLHGPKKDLTVFTIVVGSFFCALGAFLVYVIFRNLIGAMNLKEKTRTRHIQTKKMSELQKMLLEAYQKGHQKMLVVYSLTGVLLLIMVFVVPKKFLGLREMLRHAHDGGGSETVATNLGYGNAWLAFMVLVAMHLIEYFYHQSNFKKDMALGEMITVEGKMKTPYRDKKDNHRWKTVVVVGKFELEEVALAESHSFKKGDIVKVDLAINSLQPLGIQNN
jgi:hypothetical protein